MEKIIMKREWLEDIPIVRWKGIPLIRIGKDEFITAEPMGKCIRTLEIAKRMARQFAERYDCDAKVSNDTEWKEAVNYLMVNYATKKFIKNNQLNECEVLLIDDSMLGENEHILSGGKNHKINETFYGFISDFDAAGEVQPDKLVFYTIRFDSDCIEYVS